MGESFNGRPLADERNEFLEQTRQARQRRTEDLKRSHAAVTIQCHVRRFLAKKKFRSETKQRFLVVMESFEAEDGSGVMPKSRDVFHASNLVVKAYKSDKSGMDLVVLDKLCRYLIWSMNQANPVYSYIGCGLHKETAIVWIQHLKHLVICCLHSMTNLKPELVSDSRHMSLFLTALVSLTSLDKWQVLQGSQYKGLIPGMQRLNSTLFAHMKTQGNFFDSVHAVLEAGLARPGQFFIKKPNLLAISRMTIRAVKAGDDVDDEALSEYIYQILTVPAYVYYVNSMCPEGLELSLLPKITRVLAEESNIADEDLSQTLALLANVVQLGQCYGELNENFNPFYAKAIHNLLSACKRQSEGSKKSHWHPILGSVDQPVPSSLLNASALVKQQLEFLWGNVYLEAIFYTLSTYLKEMNINIADKNQEPDFNADAPPVKEKSGTFKTHFFKVFRKVLLLDSHSSVTQQTPQIKFHSDIAYNISDSCDLVNLIISTFHIFRLDILTGICFKQSSKWLVSLWKFLELLGKDFKMWIDALLQSSNTPHESLIVMFSDAMVHFITMLDDQEMYEDQQAFRLSEIAKIAQFMNHLCYRLITNANSNKLTESTWTSLKLLLLVLYRRDCRRKYCPDEHWLIEISKMTQLLSDIEKGRKNAKRVLLDMPHVLREDSRVILFRKWAASEKTLNGSATDYEYGATMTAGSTLITIQRGRIVEDGYAQLASLSPKALKGTIRVRFQNELGLDEAGIDQDGVFKEFLEETINAVFNPSLNLFKATNENLLYPSPLSYLHENHLQLFEFVGKMLAKAIYEGIVVDVHFASFFLSQILGYQQHALFSAIDELQSLDRELYHSLNYIKHYEGNIEDLELTFSVDQDFLGEIRTTELIPGGRSISVTNQNKISYLYMMAHFHLYVQIKEQTAAFLKGFRSIIPNEWIRIFSPPELQRLISGEDSDIDLHDLRRNTQYYGGFHDNHRVVVWLWEILENDFIEHERRQFLKFVTSCSKPPLLGFSNLDPPFSIRCVEVSDDEDTGDTIGSVLRGFLTIGRKDPVGRLPTSSTCFNLLKLPNYQKKSTLRDKLRYAITSNVGFELS